MIQVAKPDIREEDIAAVDAVIRSGWTTGGQKVAELEEALQPWMGGEVVVCSSATAGLHMALMAMEYAGMYKTPTVPAFTWTATANVVEMVCGGVAFCDVDPDTYNVEGIVNIGVSLFGRPFEGHCHIDDAACAFGANPLVTNDSRMALVVSFHPRKACSGGEGGAIATNDPKLARKLRALRNHGMVDGRLLMPGLNYRMTDIQAALLLGQIRRYDETLKRRREVARTYLDELAGVGWLKLPQWHDQHVWQSFVCRAYAPGTTKPPRPYDQSRWAAMMLLKDNGVETTVGTQCVPRLDYYRGKYGFEDGDFPVAEALADDTLSLPVHSRMTDSDLSAVIEAVKAI